MQSFCWNHKNSIQYSN